MAIKIIKIKISLPTLRYIGWINLIMTLAGGGFGSVIMWCNNGDSEKHLFSSVS